MTAHIKAIRSALYYDNHTVGGYYLKGPNLVGRWRGRGIQALRLNGPVRLRDLSRVLKACDPRTGQRLIKHGAKPHRAGFDVTFDFPKTLAALWAILPRDIQREIEAAFRRSIHAGLDWLESTIPLTRRGRRGLKAELAKLIMAEFDHFESRNGDPLPHCHVVFANICERLDGTLGTIASRVLYDHIRMLGPVVMACLAKELRVVFGLKLIPSEQCEGKRAGWFEVAGVSPELADYWSSRRRELMKAVDGDGPSLGPSAARARANAALSTRKAKGKPVPLEQLCARWRAEAAQHGFTLESALALFGQRDAVPKQDPYPAAWKHAVEKLTQQHATFTERRVIQEVCEQLQTGLYSGVEIAERVRHDLTHNIDIVQLKNAGVDRQFTTREMWELERAFFKDVRELKARPGLSIDDLTIGQILRRNKHLDDEQNAAIRTFLTGPGAIKMLTGVAGSGKTTVLRAMTAALESGGYRVVGASLTGIAKEELAVKANMKARTVASYLRNFDKPLTTRAKDRLFHVTRQFARAARGKKTWTREAIATNSKTVFILDEVGMLGTRDLARLTREVKKTGAHIWLVGDDKQMQSFEAGGAMRRLAKKVPHSHLSVNRRQLDEEDRLAVQAIREGKATDAIKSYFDRGRVEVGDSKSDAIDLLVRSWKSQGGVRSPEDFAIFTQTRAEAKEVNRRCQQVRLAAAATPHLTSVSNGEERFFRGDRVLFTEPNRKYSGIENGHRGTIMRIDPIRGEATVRLDHEPTLLRPKETPAQIVTIPVRKFGDAIALGYATTTHKAQSQTVKHALLLMGGDLLDQQLAYTQVSRARETTRIFIDRSHAGEQWKDLIAAVGRSRPKTTAHEHTNRATRKEIRKRLANQGPELERER